MEKIVRQTLLFDFYGELLTEHQKSIYEDVILNDMSYSEIARLGGISRQGVYDMIKRCDRILEDYEAKLKLVERFEGAKDKAARIKDSIILMKKLNKDKNLDGIISDIETNTELLFEEF